MLEAYVAGRVSADRVVGLVAVRYYGASTGAEREGLRPLVRVIEQADPGVAELVAAAGPPGFDVRVPGRKFAPEFDADLRAAARVALTAAGVVEAPTTDPPQDASLEPRLAPERPARGLLVRLVATLWRVLGGTPPSS